tara:strand:+ start:346 stop:603 length:258 start_codon:yes stop_codon:yes gene_type:complete
MNAILNNISESRKGHYVHALELANCEELKNVIKDLVNEFTEDHTRAEIIEFLTTLSIYYLAEEESEEEETALYSFDIEAYINELI